MSLLRQSSDELNKAGRSDLAYFLRDLANNMHLLVNGGGTLEDFKKYYVGFDRPPLPL